MSAWTVGCTRRRDSDVQLAAEIELCIDRRLLLIHPSIHPSIRLRSFIAGTPHGLADGMGWNEMGPGATHP